MALAGVDRGPCAVVPREKDRCGLVALSCARGNTPRPSRASPAWHGSQHNGALQCLLFVILSCAEPAAHPVDHWAK